MINGTIMLFKNMSIRHKLFFSYILIVFLPFSVYMLINNYIIFKDTKSNATLSSQKMLIQASAFIGHKVELLKNTMTAVQMSSIVQNLMKEDSKKYSENLSIWNYDMVKVKDLIFNLQPKDGIVNIRLYMKDSVTDIAETDSFLKIKNVEKSIWFKSLTSGKTTFELLPNGSFPQTEKENYISAIRKVTNSDNLREILGLIRVDMQEDTIKQILTQAKFTELSTVFLMNSRKDIICTSTNSNYVDPLLISFISKNYEQGTPNGVFWNTADTNNGKSLICIQSITGTNLILALSVPYNDILSLIRKTRNNMLIMILLVVFLALPISFFIAASATKRFFKLISHMKKVETGNFNVDIIPSNNDEIGQLTRHFNHMLTKISMLMDEKYKLGQDVKSKELKALQAQINPHFLYNTLDQINWMAIRINAPQICSLVQDLSRFYKLSLSKGEDIVTIANELDHCKTYVKIQNIRFDDSISLIIEVPNELLNYMIPKIILQPIVENSILHGILKSDREYGTIKITGSMEDKVITLTVHDDGKGMSDEISNSTPNNISAKEFHGYGINNINERLRLLYGNEYGLLFESQPGLGTTVRIRFPALL